MDKKQLITVSALGALIVALVCFMVIYSESEERLTKEQIFKLNDKIYEVSEFEKYVYITNEAEGDIDKELIVSGEKNEKLEKIDAFVQSKIYATAADQKSITFPDEELKKAKEDYASKSGDFAKYGIAEADYLRYAEDEYKMNTLYADFGNYYELPDDIYKEVVESYSGDDLKSYSYRIMKFFYEEPEVAESGDATESGDIVDEHEGHDHEHEDAIENEEEKVDRTKEAVILKAQTAWNAVKSGDDFETVAKEYADGEYAMNGNSFTFLNGQIQNKVAPIIKNESSPFSGGGLLVPTELFESMKQIESGEYTDIIEIPGESMYCFAKLESASDGFVGEADKEFRKVILNEYQYNLLIDIYNFDFEKDINTSALAKFLYK